MVPYTSVAAFAKTSRLVGDVPRLTADGSALILLIAALASRRLAAPRPPEMATTATAAPAAPAAAPAAAAPPDSWMYSSDGQPKGPLPGFSLLRLLERGVVPPTATVWAPHMQRGRP